MKYIAPIRSRLISLRAVARIPIFDRGYPNLIGTAQSTVFSDRLLLPLVFLLFFIVEVALQFFGGAFSSEFGGHPDEAAHYVTGLMVRDYIAAFQPVSPMRFAENYYLHYPKVALGHWPPFFYVVQSAWTLLFSPSRVSVLLLMALLTTLLAVTVHLAIRSEFGPKAGIAVGLLLLALPLTQIYRKMIMAEILVALLNFCAVLCFGRFLNSEKWGDAGAFGICAGLAILTKGNGLVLAFVPPLALLFSRRFHLLARPAFWCPAVIVLVFCSPVHWLTMDLIRNTWQEQAPSLTFTIAAIPYYSYHLAKVGGIGFSLLAAIGFVARIIRPGQGRRGVDGKWAAAGALLLSVWGFHFVVPVSLEARHLIPVVPALLMFLVAGIAWAAERLPLRRFTAERKAVILALAVALIFGVETFAIHKKAWYGFGKVAQQLLRNARLSEFCFPGFIGSPWRGNVHFGSRDARTATGTCGAAGEQGPERKSVGRQRIQSVIQHAGRNDALFSGSSGGNRGDRSVNSYEVSGRGSPSAQRNTSSVSTALGTTRHLSADAASA